MERKLYHQFLQFRFDDGCFPVRLLAAMNLPAAVIRNPLQFFSMGLLNIQTTRLLVKQSEVNGELIQIVTSSQFFQEMKRPKTNQGEAYIYICTYMYRYIYIPICIYIYIHIYSFIYEPTNGEVVEGGYSMLLYVFIWRSLHYNISYQGSCSRDNCYLQALVPQNRFGGTAPLTEILPKTNP